MSETTPTSIGIIMDGNRRFAKAQGMPTIEGHRLGYEKLKEAVSWCTQRGIKHLIVYAFSTENWNRTPEEVGYLTGLIKELLKGDVRTLHEKGVRLRFIGELSRFGDETVASMREIEELTKENTGLTLAVALSYGGRDEIVRAASSLVEAGTPITEASLSGALDTRGMPDPELIIRTGGRARLSNFLPWQSIYSELFFTETLWPELREEEFSGILERYAGIVRNFGA